jgi:hypothetical protein
MRPIPEITTQAEAEAAALGQVLHWRRKRLTVGQAAAAIGSRATNWDDLTIDAMRAYRALFDRQDAMLASLEQEAEQWQR